MSFMPVPRDMIKPPSIFDQYFIVSSTNSNITPNGIMEFTFVPPTVNNDLRQGYVYLNQDDVTKAIELNVGSFYLPKFPIWDINYISYKKRVCLTFSPIERYGFTDYRVSQGKNITNNFTFQFDLIDASDRWFLQPVNTPGFGVIMRTPISIPSGLASVRFSNTFFDMPVISPYFDVIYLGDATALGYPIGSALFQIINPNILNYNVGNYLIFNTPSVPGVNYNKAYIITAISTIIPGVAAAIIILNLPIPPSEINQKYNFCNSSLEINIPFRVRQLQEYRESSNRIVPSSN